MTTRHYIVLVKDGIDLDQFWNEMETGVSASPHIPKRPATIINSRELFPRLCEYELSDEEANALRNDPRVAEVDIPLDQNPDVEIVFGTIQTGNFNSRNSDSSWTNYGNWGLTRHTNIDATNNSTAQYQYTLDGTDVDVVISDSGIQADHPEFTDANGVSRVKQIDFGSYGGAYNDNNGHGTHVAGTVAGKTYGWAKNANIYSIRMGGSNPAHFNALLAWHNNKPINPVTGRKNPTVINMSWGYAITYPMRGPRDSLVSAIISNIDKVVYRGTTYPPGNLINWGIRNDSDSMRQYLQLENQAIDYLLEVLVNAGAVVCRSAMNNRYKIDVAGGADYDNYFTIKNSAQKYYYHRGFTPKSPNSICVGMIDTAFNLDGREQKNGMSCAGPGVDVFAAGHNIVSSMSNPAPGKYPAYPQNPSFKVGRMSGTSMASPQVAGMCALYLQANPTATPAQVKDWVTSSANKSVLHKAGTDDYGNDRSIFGSSAGIAYLKMSENVVSNKYKSYAKDQSGSWKPVTGKFVKQSANTWAEIQSSYIKTANGWKQTYKKGS